MKLRWEILRPVHILLAESCRKESDSMQHSTTRVYNMHFRGLLEQALDNRVDSILNYRGNSNSWYRGEVSNRLDNNSS